MSTTIDHLRQAVRTWRRAPLFFLGAMLTLALGTGANGAVFSILQAVLLQPLPYESPGRVTMVWQANDATTNGRAGTTSTTVLAWHDESSDVFEGIAALKMWNGNLGAQLDLVLADRTERLRGSLVTPNFFGVLGVRPERGRVFTSADEAAGARDLIVLSYALWQRAFGGDPGVVGRTLPLTPGRDATRPFTVVGVLPATFRFTYPLETEVWVLHPWSDIRAMFGGSIEFNGAVARLKPGVTFEQAQSRMVAVGLTKSAIEARMSTRLQPVESWVIGEVRPSMLLLGAVAIVLLLITCTTVAGLLFVRGAERQRELAVRTAMGADRWNIARLLLAEGIVLVVAGTVTGALLAALAQPVLRAIVPPVVPRADQIGVDLWTIVFAMAASVVTILLVAVAPAWRAGRFDVVSSLKRASNTASADVTTTLWRQALLALQAGLSSALLAGAVLLLVSFWKLNQVPLGFDGDRVLTVEMRLLGDRFRTPEAVAAFQSALTAQVTAVPGVVEVGLTSAVPFRGVDFMMALDRPDAPSRRYNANGRYVDPGFFSVMRIQATKGRLFGSGDTAISPKVMVVSEAFARSVFGADDPLGRQISSQKPTTIVGVVPDLRYVGRDTPPAAAVYYPMSQRRSELTCLVARTTLDAAHIGPAIRKAIYDIDPSVPTMNLTTIDRIVSDSVSNQRFLSVTTVAFSMLALLLTLVGLAVIVSRSVVERRREMAIRAALGAPSHRLVRLMTLQGLAPLAVGTLAGLFAAFLSAPVLAQFIFGVAPREPWVYAGVVAFVAVVAVPACLLPARRVTAAEPAMILKAE